jgi:phosphoglycerol transferase
VPSQNDAAAPGAGEVAAPREAAPSPLILELERRRHQRLDVAYYAAVGLIPLGIISFMLRLWSGDLSVPFVYGGDALYYEGQIKGWFQHGSYFTNSSLGAPGVSQMYDFPSADGLNVMLIRAFGFLGADAGMAINLFYLSGYVFTGLTAGLVLRRLGLSRIVALAVTVLFVLTPYHWIRGEGHLFLGIFWILPLQLLVLWWLDSDEPPLLKAQSGGFPLTLGNGRSAAALVIAAASGALGIYYMFFGCFFLVFAGGRAAVRKHAWRPLLAAGVLILVSAVVFLAQMAPSLLYQAQHGKNTQAVPRTPFESEVYGLRITQMVLPIDGHRIPALAEKRANYRLMSPGGDTEGNMAALGIVGSIGFLLAISALLFGWPRDRLPGRDEGGPSATAGGDPPVTGADRPPSLRWLGALTVAALLLGTVAGFGAVFAGLVSPQIRGYNRISVYIALFAVLTLGVLADRLIRRRPTPPWRWLSVGIVAVIVVLGVLDQTPGTLAAARQANAALYASDAAFGRQVEQTLPAGDTVFQLPYIPYPGYGVVYGLQEYDPLKGYVHSDGFRWSYGAMKGRPDAVWQESTSALPLPEMVPLLRKTGFNALWIQLNGYEDGGVAMLRGATALLGPPAILKADGAVAVWKL